MSKHEVTYDEDGLSTCDPWTLDDYLVADNLRGDDRDVVRESVLSWLAEYHSAGCDITEAMKELEP